MGLYVAYQPAPADYQTLEDRSILPIHSDVEGTNEWTNQLANTTKPIALTLDVRDCEIEITPDGDPGEISTAGRYDAANYRYETSMEEDDDRIIYKVTLRRPENPPFFIQTGQHDNRIHLRLPSDIPIAFNLTLSGSKGEIDLTNVPVADFRAQTNAGMLDVVKRDINPIQASRVDLSINAGSIRLHDLQNFNSSNVRANASMGDVRFFNSGDFLVDTDMRVQVSMGDAVVQVPESTQLTVRQSVSMGSFRGPTSLSTNQDHPALTLDAQISMGNLTLETAVSKPLVSKVLLEIVQEEGLDQALRFYEKLKKSNFKGYRQEPDALRSFGMALLENERPYDALDVLKKHAANHAGDPASFYALAQAYLAIGDYQRARSEALNALEVDADYPPAERFLRKLETDTKPPPEL